MHDINLLAVSVGNTRTRVGTFVQGQLTETAAFENQKNGKIADAIEHAFGLLHDAKDTSVLLASVNDTAAQAVTTLLEQHLECRVQRVERDVNIPIGRQLDPEAIVGEDRLLNAAAAYDVLKQACVVVDAGTAITIDFIDGQGTFHGGAITPGAQMMLDALSARTAQLPEVELTKPLAPIGHNTTEAMKAGVFYGIRGMVRELVEQFAQHAGQYPLIVATGGDANLLFRDCELIDRIVPNLTLMGLYTTMRTAQTQSD